MFAINRYLVRFFVFVPRLSDQTDIQHFYFSPYSMTAHVSSSSPKQTLFGYPSIQPNSHNHKTTARARRTAGLRPAAARRSPLLGCWLLESGDCSLPVPPGATTPSAHSPARLLVAALLETTFFRDVSPPEPLHRATEPRAPDDDGRGAEPR